MQIQNPAKQTNAFEVVPLRSKQYPINKVEANTSAIKLYSVG